MKKIINNLWLLLFCASLMTWVESCKCNSPNGEDKLCPTCEIHRQYCENFICRCPEGEEVVGTACIQIDRSNPNIFYWKPLITNGNCFDSVLCTWAVDTTSFDTTGGTTIGGNASLDFWYMGTGEDNFGQTGNFATVRLTADGYTLSSVAVCNMPCVGAVSAQGHTNLATDTFWCHFTKVSCIYPITTNYGEFDQIYVRY